jgi:glycosyltransferase involved in cell wall biosynthesis
MTQNSTEIPLVSVVMAVYNGDRYLRDTIDSVLNQTFTNFEFVIVDDGSTDQTWEILTHYASQDSRLQLFRNNVNTGQINAVNKGLYLSRGSYIARHDADDISLPERFAKQVQVLDEHPETILVSSNIDVIDGAGNLIWKLRRACDLRLIPWYLLFYNHLAGHSQVMFRREAAIDLGGYEGVDSNLDYILWNRLIKRGDFEILPDVLLLYRKHGDSVTVTQNSAQVISSQNQSRMNLEQLIGVSIPLEDVKALRGFWLFPDGEEYFEMTQRLGPGYVQRWLPRIYRSFLQHPRQLDPGRAVAARELHQLISQRFLDWTHYLRWKQEPHKKFQAFLYAFLWHPIGLFSLLSL